MGWKTGTSYGFRDSWALGVTGDHTIGVWVGRPDGSPLPGYFGVVTAAPLLFAVCEILPRHSTRVPKPAEVSQQEICWPLGTLATVQAGDLCHERKAAWILNGQAPPTFKEPDESGQTNPMQLYVPVGRDPASPPDKSAALRSVRIALWPKSLEAWLPARYTRAVQFSLADEPGSGSRRVLISAQSLKIAGLSPDTVICSAAIASGQPPATDLLALGGVGKRFWFVNGKALNPAGVTHSMAYRFPAAGQYQIAVVDEQGNTDRISVKVEDARRGE
jgi:penicillin-binding protein 1C